MVKLDLSLIQKASAFLKGKIRRTPIEFSPALSELLKVPVYLKLEFLQLTGSFKIRGGLFYLSTLTAEERKKGVAACSAGNHGLGVATAAKELGVDCAIFVPKSVDQAKYDKIRALGVEVRKSEFRGYDDTLDWTQEEAAKEGRIFISAFDDERIMAANGGTIAMEILEDLPEVENFLIPIGGGGLAAGMAYYAKSKKPEVRIFGCQHIDSPGMKISMDQGKAAMRLLAVDTVAGAIEGGMGEKCYEVLKDLISDVALLTEEEIIQGFCWMFEHHQYLVEPSCAVAVSSCLFNKLPHLAGPVVLILSGRNVSLSTIQKILAH